MNDFKKNSIKSHVKNPQIVSTRQQNNKKPWQKPKKQYKMIKCFLRKMENSS